MKLSVIVPIYKVEKYLEKCIESIISQTYNDLEIILVDDGSPDKCPEICDEFARKDGRIKVVHKENGGLLSARKAGLETATGEYVGFVDGDDYIQKDMYFELMQSVINYKSDIAICEFWYSYPDREIESDYFLNKKLYSRNELENEVFPTMLFKDRFYSFGIYPNCWSKIFKRELLNKHLPGVDNRIRLGEDASFVYPCILDCKSISYVDKPLYHYLINPESMTKKYDDTLSEIYLLPYLRIKEKSNELKYDMSVQLSYYILYLVNFVVRNEVNSDKSFKVIKEICKSEYVSESMKNIKLARLPFHTKVLFILLRMKFRLGLLLYCKLLKFVI